MPKGNPLASMCAKLVPTGLYRCQPGSLVYAELAAYADALAPLCTLLDELQQEAFFATASSFGLALWERLSGPVLDFLPLQDRRERLLCRGAITPNDSTAGGIEKALLSLGIRASVCETPDRGVYVNILSADRDLTQDQMIRAASEFLPAHTAASFDFRVLSWDFIAQKDLSFDDMDAAGLTWDQIDAYQN